MAGYVSINLHYEVTQIALTFCLPGSPPCRLVFVIPTYVNRGALLFCSALPQNLFRIRNLILPWALLALDQSAHLQISEQINTAVFWASAIFFYFWLLLLFFYSILQFAGDQYALFLSHPSPNGGTNWGEVVRRCWHTCRSWQVCKAWAERVSAPGVIYLISNPFWEESLGTVPIFTERFRVSQLTGQKGKDGLCVGDEWQYESWPSVGLWSVMRNKETVALSAATYLHHWTWISDFLTNERQSLSSITYNNRNAKQRIVVFSNISSNNMFCC